VTKPGVPHRPQREFGGATHDERLQLRQGGQNRRDVVIRDPRDLALFLDHVAEERSTQVRHPRQPGVDQVNRQLLVRALAPGADQQRGNVLEFDCVEEAIEHLSEVILVPQADPPGHGTYPGEPLRVVFVVQEAARSVVVEELLEFDHLPASERLRVIPRVCQLEGHV
jgi:hypothetical protein